MNEKKKHKIMLGIEVVLLCMIVAILGTNAASSNPPSNGVSYGKNNQTTVEGALNDLYTKANYGNATASQILKGKTALVGGKQVTGTMENRTSNTGTTGLAWSTSNYQMLGNQLRIGISPGYYGTSNYLSWGTSGIVFDNYQEKLGITADKILKGQSIAGVNGTGETTCPTCPTPESQGYVKYWKFDKDATYTRTSTGTNTTLSSGSWSRFCADNKECTYTFKVPLDSGIEVNKMYSCNVHLRTKNTNGSPTIPSLGGIISDARTRANGFRMSRGTNSSGTKEYWYMDELFAANEWGDVQVTESMGPNAGGTRPMWYIWNYGGFNVSTSTSNGNSAYTSCTVSTSSVEMKVHIKDNALSTYDSNFALSGSITYQ
jgi:hypothetical protein